ncbi:DUF5694 domain-containing protein [Dyella subtropica]|uniref:DUF5694 domain-containing protein n=1 Tax=Dyella subtropica TaxID=2992127 RepID=UPI00224CEF9E|nr:DUF5694 domain-containing protein [Dyella subtropica]
MAQPSVMVLGSAHLASLKPAPTAAQAERVIASLATYAPTAVCIEAMDGAGIETALHDVAGNASRLSTFAEKQVQLGMPQQLALGVSPADARSQAITLLAHWGQLSTGERVRLVQLQLAGYEMWSAVLNWSELGEGERAEAIKALDAETVASLDKLRDSPKEPAAIAVALAKRSGLHRIYAVDTFEDEVTMMALVPELTVFFERPELKASIERLKQAFDAHWQPTTGEGALLDTLHWFNGSDYAKLDRASEWDVFEKPSAGTAGARRLLLWNARNAELVARLDRVLASVDGERTFLVIGASHRAFLERALGAQPWLEVVPSERFLAEKAVTSR